MIQNIEEKLTALDPKMNLKNYHLVHSVKVYNNNEILVILDSSIQFHSLSKLAANLPSLIYVLEVGKVEPNEKANYQDQLSNRISTL